MLSAVPAENRDDCWWFVLRDGTPVPGDGGGGVPLLLELRTTRPIGLLLDVLRAGRLVDAFDKRVARHRGTLGRFVPDGPAPRRYP